MSKKDILKEWFRELPQEQASSDFTTKVMKRVMSEWRLNPVKYQPIISRKAWWMIGLMAFAITSTLFSLHSLLPNTSDLPNQTQTLYGINISQIFIIFSGFFDKLNNISPAVAVGALAIIALWFFDKLFTRAVRR
jgi:hypothetical protein